ncbi:hypothetical protein L1987_77880 [Smallanthus sonchifolius]|uniref:Uncharacterized protein n=1 Tax=Smallanthus sonchifolius TaxID=185202 RepID=A0ACB8ZA87_9ASTR|nr:hypothetical protein L1987_77880 [Smallanthus sonchifolius]
MERSDESRHRMICHVMSRRWAARGRKMSGVEKRLHQTRSLPPQADSVVLLDTCEDCKVFLFDARVLDAVESKAMFHECEAEVGEEKIKVCLAPSTLLQEIIITFR